MWLPVHEYVTHDFLHLLLFTLFLRKCFLCNIFLPSPCIQTSRDSHSCQVWKSIQLDVSCQTYIHVYVERQTLRTEAEHPTGFLGLDPYRNRSSYFITEFLPANGFVAWEPKTTSSREEERREVFCSEFICM